MNVTNKPTSSQAQRSSPTASPARTSATGDARPQASAKASQPQSQPQDRFDVRSSAQNIATRLGASAAKGVEAISGLGATGHRGLSEAEKTEMRKIYGDSIDYDKVQVAQMPPWVEKANGGRAFVLGNTVYMPKQDFENLNATKDQPGSAGRSLIAHEMGHVWQFQNKGIGYLPEALWAQNFGDAYNFAKALDEGKAFSQMDPEQQAEMMSHAYEDGFFDDPDAKFVTRQTTEWPYYESKVIGANDPIPEGFTDNTDALREAHQYVQSGGRPAQSATPTPVPRPTPPAATPEPQGTPTPEPQGTPTPEPRGTPTPVPND
ncbi:MAG: DUF4157 domain-containing protein [Myxococcaceae bacterium]|nr:DUF4157 domain-containing protein [Myxococcaceae bacterium]